MFQIISYVPGAWNMIHGDEERTAMCSFQIDLWGDQWEGVRRASIPAMYKNSSYENAARWNYTGYWMVEACLRLCSTSSLEGGMTSFKTLHYLYHIDCPRNFQHHSVNPHIRSQRGLFACIYSVSNKSNILAKLKEILLL